MSDVVQYCIVCRKKYLLTVQYLLVSIFSSSFFVLLPFYSISSIELTVSRKLCVIVAIATGGRVVFRACGHLKKLTIKK